jgi:hypothetical protein
MMGVMLGCRTRGPPTEPGRAAPPRASVRMRRVTARTRGHRWSIVCTDMCPEPDLNRHAREGAARFKLAVSAFHHPGVARGSALAHEPIGTRLPNSGGVTRCCLILLASEGSSALGGRHRHMPEAGRRAVPSGTGMTKSRRPITHPDLHSPVEPPFTPAGVARGVVRGVAYGVVPALVPGGGGAARRSSPEGGARHTGGGEHGPPVSPERAPRTGSGSDDSAGPRDER